jgi:hypothetical protein
LGRKDLSMTDSMIPTAASVIDSLIKGIVAEGHPKASRLAEDYNSGRDRLMSGNPRMTMAEATVETLVDLLREAYGIRCQMSLADYLNFLDGPVVQEDATAILSAADEIRAGNILVEPAA